MEFLKKYYKVTSITVIVLLVTLVAVTRCFAVLPKANMLPSDYDLGVTYQMAAEDNKPILAVFYVDWCTYCKRFMPKLDKVRNLNKNDFNVVLINAENPENNDLIKENRISGYPTVYILDPKYDNRVHIDNVYMETVTDLNKEVKRYSNFRKLILKGGSCK